MAPEIENHITSKQRSNTAKTATSPPSFAKGMFLGHILSEKVFPYAELPKEQQALVTMTVDAIEKMGKSMDVARIEENKKIPSEILAQLKEMGLFGLVIPEEYGGFGLNTTGYVQILTAIGNVDTSLTATVGAHQSIGLKALLLFGSKEQKQTYLPKLASGEMIAAFGLTEPGAGSDARSIKTKAELSANGKHYILNGSKIWITNGGIADFFTVFARTEHKKPDGSKKDKITAFIVTRDMDGFSSGPEEKKMGLVGSSTTTLNFENVKVPIENVLGEPGDGFKVALSVLNNGRLGLAGACAIGSRAIIKLSVDHATQRRQFDKSLIEFGLIQSKIANMTIDAYAAEAMVRVSAHLMDSGEEDYSIETAMCKIFCTEMEWRTINEALQISGGSGYMKEYPYEKVLRDSRIFTIWEGTNEILRLMVGLSGLQAPGEQLKVLANVIKQPLNDIMHSLGVLSDFGVRWIQRRVTTREHLAGVHPDFAKEAATFEKYTSLFAAEVETSLLRHGKRIVENQFAVRRLADISIDLYAIACVLSRASKERETKNEMLPSAQIAKAFVRKARRRVAENIRRMAKNDDELEASIVNKIIQKGDFPASAVFL